METLLLRIYRRARLSPTKMEEHGVIGSPGSDRRPGSRDMRGPPQLLGARTTVYLALADQLMGKALLRIEENRLTGFAPLRPIDRNFALQLRNSALRRAVNYPSAAASGVNRGTAIARGGASPGPT